MHTSNAHHKTSSAWCLTPSGFLIYVRYLCIPWTGHLLLTKYLAAHLARESSAEASLVDLFSQKMHLTMFYGRVITIVSVIALLELIAVMYGLGDCYTYELRSCSLPKA